MRRIIPSTGARTSWNGTEAKTPNKCINGTRIGYTGMHRGAYPLGRVKIALFTPSSTPLLASIQRPSVL